jgi:hypothetical protein
MKLRVAVSSATLIAAGNKEGEGGAADGNT